VIRILISLSLFILTSCTGEEAPIKESRNTAEFHQNEIWSPEIVISQEEQLSIRTVGDRLIKNDGEDALLFGNVLADFYQDDGSHSSVMYSDSALIHEQSNNFEAIGNVRVVSDSGLTLETHRLIWDNRYRMIISHDSVLFTTEEMDTLYGTGFESDMDLSHWRIKDPSGVTSRELR